MKSAKTQDMTTGKIVPMLIAFAIPIMGGNLFQQLYTVVDTMIVGRFLGVSALAAVGAGGWMTWMLLGAIMGMSEGFANPVAQAFGAGDIGRVRKTMGNSLVLSAIIAIVLTVIGQLILVPMMKLLNIPDEIFDMALLYLRIYYLGAPIMMAYNFAACHLRALGNSKDPVVAVVIGAISNIILDILFVGPLKMGIAGAVIATLIAQVFSAIYSYICLFKIDFVRFSKDDFYLLRDLCGRLLYMGIPMAFQNVVVSIGGIILQLVVNLYGIAFIAGWTATSRLYGLLEIAGISLAYALTTFVGQNRGAGKIGRAREGIRKAMILALCTSVILALIFITFGKYILMLFISGTPQEVEATMMVAYRYLTVMSMCLPLLYCLHIIKCALVGLGNSTFPMWSGVAELFMRAGSAFILPYLWGEMSLFFAEPLAWLGADVVMLVGYFSYMKKLRVEEKEGGC